MTDSANNKDLDALEAALAGRRDQGEIGELTELLLDHRPELDRAQRAQLDQRLSPLFNQKSGGATGGPSGGGLAMTIGVGVVVFIIILAILSAVSSAPETSIKTDGKVMASKPLSTPNNYVLKRGEPSQVSDTAGAGQETEMSAQVKKNKVSAEQPVPASATVGSGVGADAKAGVGAATKDREVAKTAEMQIIAKKTDKAAEGAMRITDELGGIVFSSDLQNTISGGSAQLDLRVPSDRLGDALERLSRLGRVSSRSQHSLDITSSFDDLAERERVERATRNSLLTALSKAKSDEDRASLRRQLEINQSSLAAIDRERKSLKETTNYSRISLEILSEPPAAIDIDEEQGFGIARALEIAGQVLSQVGAALVLVLLLVAPFALVGGAGWGLWRRLVRRRRERVLDSE